MKKKRKNRIVLIVFLCFLLYILFGLYSSKCGLTTSEFSVIFDRCSSSIKIIQITDLHNSEFGSDNERLISKVKKQQPDLIVLTGDLINYDELDISVATNLIQNLNEIAPVYLSFGNHEIDYEKVTGMNLKEVFEDAGAMVLDKDYVDVQIKNQTIRIGGVYGYCLPEEYSSWDGYDKGECDFLNEFQNTDNYKILLSHLPTPWLEYGFTKTWDIDCIFTGHLHGGQVRLPFIGGVYAPEFGWFPGKLEGVYERDQASVVLSRGLGSYGAVPRFNNIPEIVVVDLVEK